jgi:hypothetical protein
VQSEGKSAVSIWQLRRHLQLYADDAEAAVTTAPALIAAQPLLPTDVDELTAYDWLRKSQLEAHADAFEEVGFKSAADLYSKELPEEIKGVPKPVYGGLLSTVDSAMAPWFLSEWCARRKLGAHFCWLQARLRSI